MSKEELGNMLAQDRLPEIIDGLLGDLFFEDDNSVKLLSGSLVALKKKEKDGIISQSDALLERNRISFELGEIIQNLPNDDVEKIAIIDGEKQILLRRTPPQYQTVEDVLKHENKYWLAIKLKRIKNSEALTIYYCQNISQIIGLERVSLSENKTAFSSYYDVAVESLKRLIQLTNLLLILFKNVEITEIGEKSEELKGVITQIKLNLLNIEGTNELIRFHAIKIRPLVSELVTLETLLKSIYEE